ncbi:ABC transporter substrate-binding protein [Bariatricus sp. HCP28S3_C2]|uniref:ABC transporter substrate-binding protein n=2 Tax=unclassified Bariatricus TaxID=2677046 RepID=UPI003F8CC748
MGNLCFADRIESGKRDTMKKRAARFLCMILITVLVFGISGCGPEEKTKPETEENKTTSESQQEEAKKTSGPLEIKGLSYESAMELDYAKGFGVYYYQDGYKLIRIRDGEDYLLVPEGRNIPSDLEEDIVILHQPLDRIYLAATSVMALFDSLDALDAIRLSGTQKSGWYIENAVQAMEDGAILYAGKYSEPDYELLIDEECDLAIESTMILHTPKVQEMLEMLEIPVFIDRSSYETHPLGRTEWIKVYAAMLDKEEQAETFFKEQSKVIEELKDFENTEQTVAFFYVSTDGTVVVRKSEDYIPKMIEIAGGRYVFDDLENTENNSASISISMEEFFASAADADYLIYNSSIDNPVESMEDLLAKSELFADFKAVREGNVWCTGKYLYQATDIVGNLITDIHLMLTDGKTEEMTFLYKVS